MPNIPASLYTPTHIGGDTTKPTRHQIGIVIDGLVTKVLKGALGLTVHTDKDDNGITLRINY